MLIQIIIRKCLFKIIDLLKRTPAVEKLNSSAELHRPLKAFCDSDLLKNADEDTFRCATLLLHDFEQSGINLPETENSDENLK